MFYFNIINSIITTVILLLLQNTNNMNIKFFFFSISITLNIFNFSSIITSIISFCNLLNFVF